jgi:Low-density lipoprotein receptor domain class A
VVVNFAAYIPADWGSSSAALQAQLLRNVDMSGYTVILSETGRPSTAESRVLVSVVSKDGVDPEAFATSLSTSITDPDVSLYQATAALGRTLVSGRSLSCSGFLCPTSHRCIDSTRLCDGFPDCEYISVFQSATQKYLTVAADEVGCSASVSLACTPSNGYFKCSDGSCIQDVFWCDGVSDCTDGSDETSTDCVSRKSLLAKLGTPTATQWAGFRFGTAFQPQCVLWGTRAEASSLYSALRFFACEESLVYRSGAITLRDPYKLCRQLGTAKFDLSKGAGYAGLFTPLGKYSIATPFESVCYSNSDCFSSMGSAYKCFSSTTGEQLLTFEGSMTTEFTGICLIPRVGVKNTAPSNIYAETCSMAIPISIIVARTIYNRYSKLGGSVIHDGTYRCYCAQLVEYNLLTDPLYTLPPYDSSEEKKICQVYFQQLVEASTMTYTMVAVVTALNFFLNITLRFFANFEKQFSLSDKVNSEMRKLFMATLINTSIIMLLVNGYFSGSDSNAIGFGGGQYSDFTKPWFVVIGASYTLTMIATAAMFILGKITFNWLTMWLFRRLGEGYKTQEMMNEAYMFPKFYLAIAVAQLSVIVCSCILYSSGLPVLIPVAFLFCVVTYWSDKYQLLRMSRIPPQLSADIVIWAVQFMTIAIFVHSLITIWLYSDPVLFPSPLVTSWMSGSLSDLFSVSSGQTPSSSAAYSSYLTNRLGATFTQAAAPSMLLAVIIFWYLFASSIFALGRGLVNLLRICLCCKADKVDSFGGFTQATYSQAVQEMIRLRVVYTYDIFRIPKYTKAVRAITSMDQQYRLRSSAQSAN